MKPGCRGTWYWNRDTQRMERKPPPPKLEIHAVVQDTIPPTEYMGNADREMFDSRSALKRRTEADGYEITGGDHLTGKHHTAKPYKADPQEIKNDVARTLNNLKYGMEPQSEWDKEKARRELREREAHKRRQKVRWAS